MSKSRRRSTGPGPARAPRWWSQRSTGSAPTATSSSRPASRCTTPSTRRSRSSARARSTRRPSAGIRCPASGPGWSPTASSPPSRATRSPRRSVWRCRRRSTSASTARCRSPKTPSNTSTPRRHPSMARELPYIAAINEAIHGEMARDDSVLYYGQNLATTENDELVKAFGHDRVRVTPISETAEIGMAVGAALAGMRPIVELYMAEFMLVAMDQVVNEAPRFRYMSGGKVNLRLLLMATAIRDDNPVCFFHHYLLTLEPGEVPEGEYLVPFGQADVRRSGGDVTVVATGWMVGKALAAAEALAAEGIEAEVIDPRTLAPLDTETILSSVAKTGRVVLVDQAPRPPSAAGAIHAG